MVNRGLYLGPSIGDREAMGRHARRRSVSRHFNSVDVPLESAFILRSCRRGPDLLTTVGSWRDAWKAHAVASRQDGVIVLDGLDTFVVSIPYLAVHRRRRNRTIVDICDSRVTLAGGVGETSLRRRLVFIGLLRWVAGWTRASLYISARDLDADEALWSAGRRLEVPNLVDLDAPRAGAVDVGAEGYYLLIGDWAYRPNTEMLDAARDWYAEHPTSASIEVVVVGPNLEGVDIPSSWRRVGWVEHAAPWYAGARALLAPLRSGGGVKNKVQEALSLGVPVIGTHEAFIGLDCSHLMIPFDNNATPDDVAELATQRAAAPGIAHEAAPPVTNSALQRALKEVIDA